MMSVAILGATELGAFAACAVKLKKASLNEMTALLELVSVSNCAAFAAQYNETQPHVTADEIEGEALKHLIQPGGLLQCSFGPFFYNMKTNNGELFVGELSVGAAGGALAVLPQINALRLLEKQCAEYLDSERRKIQTQAENDAAFVEEGPLPKLTAEEINARMVAAGCQRVIVATYCVDESDCQSDYFGHRNVREVAIGFGKGTKENFQQLRKAAALFPPTAEFAPGHDIVTVRVVFTNKIYSNGYYYEGSGSHWHDDVGNGKQFSTRSEAEAFIASAPKPHDIHFGNDQVGTFEWQIGVTSYEHRECYSMGGGNYLGDRHHGWKVWSRNGVSNSMEFFEPPRKTKR